MDVEVLRDGFGEVVEEPAELPPPGGAGSIGRAPHRWLRPGPQTTTWFRGGGSRGCAAPQALDASAAPLACAPTLESAASRPRTTPPRARGGCRYRPTMSAYLLDEQRIARQLEGLAAMRLQTERTPDAAYRRRAQPTRLGHRARAPMRSTCRDRLQGLHHHPLHVVVPNRAWRSRSRLVHQTIAAGAQKTPPPLAAGTTGGAQFAGYLPAVLGEGQLAAWKESLGADTAKWWRGHLRALRPERRSRAQNERIPGGARLSERLLARPGAYRSPRRCVAWLSVRWKSSGRRGTTRSGQPLAVLIRGQRLRRRVHAHQHLIPRAEQKQPEAERTSSQNARRELKKVRTR